MKLLQPRASGTCLVKGHDLAWPGLPNRPGPSEAALTPLLHAPPFPSQVWRDQGGTESVTILPAQFAVSFLSRRLLLVPLCCPDWARLRAVIASNLSTVPQKQTNKARVPLLRPTWFLSGLCCYRTMYEHV